MAELTVALIAKDDLLDRFAEAAAKLGDIRLRQALARAINHTGDKAFTAVRRELVKRTSLPRNVVNKALDKKRASFSSATALEYRIRASGRATPLGAFSPSQFSYGVRAKVWGRAQQFRGAFIVPAYGGQVFHREGKARGPLEMMWGPSVASEIVRDETLDAFETVASELRPRINHEIERLIRVV